MIDCHQNNYDTVDYFNTTPVSIPFTPQYKVEKLITKERSTDFSNKFHKFQR